MICVTVGHVTIVTEILIDQVLIINYVTFSLFAQELDKLT